jgi:large subunit ribosomal protein L29
MKAKDLRAKQPAELEEELKQISKAHFGLRMQLATQQISDFSQLQKARRDIARVKTILSEKKRQA